MNISLEEKGFQEIISLKQSKVLFYTSNELIAILPEYHSISDSDCWVNETGQALSSFLPPVLYQTLISNANKLSDSELKLNDDLQLIKYAKGTTKGNLLVMSLDVYKLITSYHQLKKTGWKTDGFSEYNLKSGELTYNKAHLSQLGYKSGELKETLKEFKSLVHPDDVHMLNAALILTTAKGKSFCNTVRLLTQRKRYRWYELSGKTIRLAGSDEILALFTTKDVTPYQSEIEKLSKENRDLKRSNIFRSHFLEKMSHAIRSPLNSISGFSGMILDDDFSKKEKAEFADIIERNSDNMVNMIRDFTETIRIESGEIELYKRFFDPNIILLNLFCEYESKRSTLDKEHIKINLQIPEDQSVSVHADKSRFTQVFDQLLDNALKFTNEGSINFGYELKKEKLTFFIKDTGIGINPDKHRNLFEIINDKEVKNPYEQFKNGGTGLYICKHLIELMEGELSVKSKPTIGTKFHFSLPFKQQDSNPFPLKHISSQNSESYKWAGKKVLIVDDAPEIHRFIKLSLKNTSITCLYAESGQACINLLGSISDIDVILMDIQMPDLNGIATIQKIHEKNPDLPVIALTAHALGGDEENLKRYGFIDYIPKPIQRKRLYSSMRSVLK